MPAIPTAILKHLYVPGSLANTPEGCQLQIKNTLAPARITRFGPVTIDGVAHAQQDVVLMRGNERLPAAAVAPAHPLTFDINTVVTIAVPGVALAAGEHRVGLDVTTREAGRLTFEIAASVHA